MTINDVQFSMKIQRLQVNPNNGIKENVVHRVHWSLEARYTNPVTGEEFMAPLDDVTTIEFVDSAGYVPFENLTEQNLVSWVEARENQRTRNIEWRKQKVFELLKKKVNPDNVTIDENSLPWIQQTNSNQ